MPHDKNGNALAVGDIVLIRAKVTTVSAGEEYCNLNLETVEPMFPGVAFSALSLNAKQVERIGSVVGGVQESPETVQVHRKGFDDLVTINAVDFNPETDRHVSEQESAQADPGKQKRTR